MNFNLDISSAFGVLAAISFLVNIIVQLTKEYIPFPTKLWCIIVSVVVTMAAVYAGISFHILDANALSFILCFFCSFIVAYISMHGFDVFKELWERFKNGDDINE